MCVLKFTSDAVTDIKGIPKALRNCLKKELLEQVADNPCGCSKELKGKLSGYRSFCWQGYRVVYKIFPDLRAVAVVGVGLRDAQSRNDVYRRLEQMARTGELAQQVLFSMRGFSVSDE